MTSESGSPEPDDPAPSRWTRRQVLAFGLGGVAAGIVAGAAGVELVAHGVLLGKNELDTLDGACSVASPTLIYSALGPAMSSIFYSQARNRTVGYTIAYPPGHGPGSPLPLIVMLHGFGGNHTNALSGIHPAQAVALHVDGQPLAPVAMVTVDGGGGYWNPHPGDDPMAMVIDELIRLCQHLGLGAPPLKIGTMSISMGGYGAILLAEKYPHLISAVAAISPAIWTSYTEAHGANAGAYASAEDFASDDAVTHASALVGARRCGSYRAMPTPSTLESERWPRRSRRERSWSSPLGATPVTSSRRRSHRRWRSWLTTWRNQASRGEVVLGGCEVTGRTRTTSVVSAGCGGSLVRRRRRGAHRVLFGTREQGRTMATTTPSQTPLKVARTFFDALSKNDLDSAMEFITHTTVDDFVAIGEIRGKSAIRRFLDELFAAFPDFEMTVDRIVADRSTAVVQWHANGTFSGAKFQGIDPTAKHVEIRGVDVMEITEGLVRHDTIYYDGASFARQVGMLPRSGSGIDKAMLSLFNTVTQVRQRFP